MTKFEVDSWVVITNDGTNKKIGFGRNDRLFPVLAILDPELMTTVPPKMTHEDFIAIFERAYR